MGGGDTAATSTPNCFRAKEIPLEPIPEAEESSGVPRCGRGSKLAIIETKEILEQWYGFGPPQKVRKWPHLIVFSAGSQRRAYRQVKCSSLCYSLRPRI
ncbi:hypothetical protein NL676_018165 [Syzygium grande]|nr:hypothetical protein NL676_018165 [Syzygium grande]